VWGIFACFCVAVHSGEQNNLIAEDACVPKVLFTPGQQVQIDKGVAAGVDVRLYSKVQYNWLQMREIRLGLEQNQPVGFYLEPMISWGDMRWMRGWHGIEDNSVTSEQYQRYLDRVRCDDCDDLFVADHVGASVTDWLRDSDPEPDLRNYDGQRVQLIHLGIMKNLDVYSYAWRGFDPQQMQLIMGGLEAGDDIARYAHPEWSIQQMRDIKDGKEPGKAANFYLDQDFSEGQWKQLVFGLDKGIDVAQYADKRYSAEQMFVIALGLLQVLDVTRYCDPTIPAERMDILRIGLSDGIDLEDVENLKYLPYYERLPRTFSGLATCVSTDSLRRMRVF
jgi:hypothetical protein